MEEMVELARVLELAAGLASVIHGRMQVTAVRLQVVVPPAKILGGALVVLSELALGLAAGPAAAALALGPVEMASRMAQILD